MAVQRLLNTRLPWQIVNIEDTYASRVQFVHIMLGQWPVPSQRAAIVAECFDYALTQSMEELAGWVADTDAPYAHAALSDHSHVSA